MIVGFELWVMGFEFELCVMCYEYWVIKTESCLNQIGPKSLPSKTNRNSSCKTSTNIYYFQRQPDKLAVEMQTKTLIHII